MELFGHCRNLSSNLVRRTLYKTSYLQSSRNKATTTDAKKEHEYDVIIAGGGIVGTAMACALSQSSFLSDKRVLLLEAGSPQIMRELPHDYSNRVSTINPSSVELFQKMGVWEDIQKLRVQPVKKMQIWESCSDSFITYDKDQMTEDIAFVIENDVMISSLLKRLEQDAGRVTIFNKTRVKKYTLPKSLAEENNRVPLAQVDLEDGRTLHTNLLIGADGYNSLVRQTMGVHYVNWSYRQKAIVATLELSEKTNNVVAWQRFLPTGPVALLPLSDSLSSLVWTNTPQNCDALLALSNDEFVDALNGALWHENDRIKWVEKVCSAVSDMLPNLQTKTTATSNSSSVRQLPPNVSSVKNGSRAAFPLGLGHSSYYVKPRVALIGDAAHRVHPLAGLGVNLGLGDVSELAQRLEAAVYGGCEIGNWHHLKDYERNRQRHVVPTMAAIDGLHRLYTTEMPFFVLLRSLGLKITDSCEPLKQRIITHASS